MTASARARPSPLEQPVMNQVDMLFLSEGGPVRAAEARTVDPDRLRSAGRFPSRERSQPHGAVAGGWPTARRAPPARTAFPGRGPPGAGLGEDGRGMVTAPPPPRPDAWSGGSRPLAVIVLREYR